MENSKLVAHNPNSKFDIMGDKSPSKATDDGKPTKQKRERRVDDKKDTKQGEDALPEAAKGRRNRGTVGERNDGDSGGWMGSSNSNGKSVKAINRFEPEDDPKEAPITNMNKDKHFRDDSEEIMIIPDLDEEGGAEDTRIAHAPRNVNRKIPTLSELEYEVKVAMPNSADGYNLSILLNSLVPAAMVYEADVPWTFESLLREVTDELTFIPKTVVNAPSAAVTPSVLSPAAAVKPNNAANISNNHSAAAASGGFLWRC